LFWLNWYFSFFLCSSPTITNFWLAIFLELFHVSDPAYCLCLIVRLLTAQRQTDMLWGFLSQYTCSAESPVQGVQGWKYKTWSLLSKRIIHHALSSSPPCIRQCDLYKATWKQIHKYKNVSIRSQVADTFPHFFLPDNLHFHLSWYTNEKTIFCIHIWICFIFFKCSIVIIQQQSLNLR